MKKIKTFEKFIKEGLDNAENAGLYDEMSELLNKANILISKSFNDNLDEYSINSPEEALDLLYEISEDSEYYAYAQELIADIEDLNDQIDEMDAEEFYNESVGEYEPSFVDVNIDETELEDSDRPNLGKLKQKPGKIIIETPSKTDAYNAKMRLGGEVIQDPKFHDKQIHVVKPTK